MIVLHRFSLGVFRDDNLLSFNQHSERSIQYGKYNDSAAAWHKWRRGSFLAYCRRVCVNAVTLLVPAAVFLRIFARKIRNWVARPLLSAVHCGDNFANRAIDCYLTQLTIFSELFKFLLLPIVRPIAARERMRVPAVNRRG